MFLQCAKLCDVFFCRINQITQHEFNSCFMNLYRTGHDSHPWHADVHPAYGANPPVATISLGMFP
jgi:alkylated DNA repair dioxygenase AlkB